MSKCLCCKKNEAQIALTFYGPEIICRICYYSGSIKSQMLLGFNPLKK